MFISFSEKGKEVYSRWSSDYWICYNTQWVYFDKTPGADRLSVRVSEENEMSLVDGGGGPRLPHAIQGKSNSVWFISWSNSDEITMQQGEKSDYLPN